MSTQIVIHIGENEHGAWVLCDDCDFDERMLTLEGAALWAKEHAQIHITIEELVQIQL